RGGASRYDGKSFKHFTREDGLGSLTVYCMLEDKAGNIWFGSVDAGASRFDGKTFTNYSAIASPPTPAPGGSKGSSPKLPQPTSHRGQCRATLGLVCRPFGVRPVNTVLEARAGRSRVVPS